MKIIIDANIALDVLLERHPFYIAGTHILGLSNGGIELYISASTITDIYYIIKKELKCKKTAAVFIKNLIKNVNIAAVSGNEICKALDFDWNDFEDAVQYAVGESITVDYLVTRNVADFTSATMPVVTPDELLNILVNGEIK